MANDLHHQSLRQETERSNQETSNQGSSISFDFEGSVPAIAQLKSMACLGTATIFNQMIPKTVMRKD